MPAVELLEKSDNSAYDGYQKELLKFQRYFRSLKESDWNSTLYLKWIYTLYSLFENTDGNEYRNKRLIRSFLGSFAQLRHDTILYVKQSYTMRTVSMPPMRPKVKNKLRGYPENNALFWARFVDLCEISGELFGEDYGIRMNFDTLSKLGKRMAEILKKGVSDDDMEYFYKFPDLLEQMLGSIAEKTKRVLNIADIHTDSESGNVLEIGVGGFSRLFIIDDPKDAHIFIGPVFNFYEFRMPMSQRLTNDEFEELLKDNKVQIPVYLK